MRPPDIDLVHPHRAYSPPPVKHTRLPPNSHLTRLASQSPRHSSPRLARHPSPNNPVGRLSTPLSTRRSRPRRQLWIFSRIFYQPLHGRQSQLRDCRRRLSRSRFVALRPFVPRSLILYFVLCTFALGPCWATTSRVARVQGDVVVGGMFPVHTDGPNQACAVLREDGIQFVEAMLYALKLVNEGRDGIALPGFRLGAEIRDSCGDEQFAVEQLMHVFKSRIKRMWRDERGGGGGGGGEGEAGGEETEGGSEPCLGPEEPGGGREIIGIIGGESSSVSLQMAKILSTSIFRSPQISYGSSNPDLGNRERFPYFLRTVPTDTNQAMAIVKVMQSFDWKYVSLVYDDTAYGSQGASEFTRLLGETGICVATRAKIQMTNPDFGPKDYERIVEDILQSPNANVVVMYTGEPEALKLFEAARALASASDLNKRQKIRELVWVGSDAWSSKMSVTPADGNSRRTTRSSPLAAALISPDDDADDARDLTLAEIVDGAITVQPRARGFADFFQDHLAFLTPAENNANPWFNEFWEQHFHCKFLPEGKERLCEPGGEEAIDRSKLDSHFVENNRLHFVRDAVFAYAHALKALHSDYCGANRPGICEEMQAALDLSGADAGEEMPLLKRLRNVSFKDSQGRRFYFVDGNSGPPEYSVMTFAKEVGVWKWKEVGKCTGTREGSLQWNVLFESLRKPVYPESVCSHRCAAGNATVFATGGVASCCWKCVPCVGKWQIVVKGDSPGGDEVCSDCPNGTVPNANFSLCLPIPEEFLGFDETFAIIVASIASTGLFFTLVVGAIFVAFGSTPFVKAAGREMSTILLAGVAMSYGVVFLLLTKPTLPTCALERVVAGLAYTMCYASIATKTNRIARIFDRKHKLAKSQRFTSPKSQVVITFLLIVVEAGVITAWLIVEPPATQHVFPTRTSNLLICRGSNTASYFIGFLYPLVLILFSSIFAYQTRKSPVGFNETRQIVFCNYTATALWFAFIPVYLSTTSPRARTLSLAFSLILNATTILGFLFVPKVYIVLFRPERNTQQAVMASHGRSISRSASRAGSVVGGVGGIGSPERIRFLNNGQPVPNLSESLSLGSLFGSPRTTTVPPNNVNHNHNSHNHANHNHSNHNHANHNNAAHVLDAASFASTPNSTPPVTPIRLGAPIQLAPGSQSLPVTAAFSYSHYPKSIPEADEPAEAPTKPSNAYGPSSNQPPSVGASPVAAPLPAPLGYSRSTHSILHPPPPRKLHRSAQTLLDESAPKSLGIDSVQKPTPQLATQHLPHLPAPNQPRLTRPESFNERKEKQNGKRVAKDDDDDDDDEVDVAIYATLQRDAPINTQRSKRPGSGRKLQRPHSVCVHPPREKNAADTAPRKESVNGAATWRERNGEGARGRKKSNSPESPPTPPPLEPPPLPPNNPSHHNPVYGAGAGAPTSAASLEPGSRRGFHRGPAEEEARRFGTRPRGDSLGPASVEHAYQNTKFF